MCGYTMPDTIVVASGNAHKIEEIRQIFSDVKLIPMREVGFDEDIAETGKTFRENACIKARAVCNRLKLPTLADDSGLCVDSLGGAPGVYSARFSGGNDKDNRELLLKRLTGIDYRKAHFACAVCLAYPDGRVLFGEGATYGEIGFTERGNSGFGYDSLFISDDLGKTFGEATAEEKNSVSHRYRALKDLRSKL